MLAENLLAKFKQTPMAITALRALKGERAHADIQQINANRGCPCFVTLKEATSNREKQERKKRTLRPRLCGWSTIFEEFLIVGASLDDIH